MSIFNAALTLIRSTETHLVFEKNSEIRFLGHIKRIIWLPAKFLKMGISEKLKGTTTWSILAFISLILVTWLINNSSLARTESGDLIVMVTMIIPIVLVVFALPSTYGNSGVSNQNVEFVVQQLRAQGFSRTYDIELLKKSVKSFEDRAKFRINALKWLTGLLWAGFVYIFSKGMDGSTSDLNAYKSYILTSSWMFIGVFFAYLSVWGYEASVDRLFRAIDFGCNDFCLLMENT
ncbi:hypothetical protein ACOTH4_09460 [Achromobacter xylosoxidans]